jgi:CheY-like chemotaxis protein
MKNVLIADDDKTFLLSLKDGLDLHYGNKFNVLAAENGKKAAELLEKNKVDLVVTDLKMPVMDGFELLAYMSKNHPNVPVMVMTAFGNPEIEDRLRTLDFIHYVEKPLDFHELASKIIENLVEGPTGQVHAALLPTFLQLAELEKKSCTVRVQSEAKVGYLYFIKGNLVDAESEGKKGEEAALEILGWGNVSIEIGPGSKKRKKTIDLPLDQVMLAMLKEGQAIDQKERREEEGIIETEAVAEIEFKEMIHLNSLDKQETPLPLRKEAEMALEKHIQALKEIKGYIAAGIMNFTGEMLASDSADQKIDLNLVGATFNDIFRSAHEASKKIGLDACKETTIATPKGVILMRCSGTDAKVHFHLIGVLAADGNQALMKMQMEKMVPAVMAEL